MSGRPVMAERAGARAALAATLALAVATIAGATAHPLAAQGAGAVVTVRPPAGDSVLQSVTPSFFIQATNVGTALPLRFRFEIDTSPRFTRPIRDTLVTTRDSSLVVAFPLALEAEGRAVYWRAQVIDPAGVVASSPVGGPRVVPFWVRLVAPRVGTGGVVVRSRRPRFVWQSPAVSEPPGPWEYALEIDNLGNRVIAVPSLRDTTYVPPRDLEANAQYRWQVTARLPRTGQASVVRTSGTFIVEDSSVATSTVLYQNFPNPFPRMTARGLVGATCIWFDLAAPARVRLDIHNLRGLPVRRLLPRDGVDEPLPAGRYGRARVDVNEACDGTLEWDGRDDAGRTVPPGIYLLRFRADGVTTVKKILFNGTDGG